MYEVDPHMVKLCHENKFPRNIVVDATMAKIAQIQTTNVEKIGYVLAF